VRPTTPPRSTHATGPLVSLRSAAATQMIDAEDRTVRVVGPVSPPYSAIIVEARYRRADWPNAWILTHWRIDAGCGYGFSEWRKIHRNRRRDLGALRLVTIMSNEQITEAQKEDRVC